ncbi:MAG: fructosamine kinase family protein [Balneolaceae bacterium]
MELPKALSQHLADKTELSITGSEPLSGGSINRAAKLKTPGGDLFLKWNTGAPRDMFEKEKKGLQLLERAATNIRVPEVIDLNSGDNSLPGYLLMTYIEPHRGSREASCGFGEQLAALHSHTEEDFGLSYDNYIGRLPQSNRKHPGWTDFFIRERIEPQLKRALDADVLEPSVMKQWNRLAARLPDLFPEARPSLLHGDLWGGNYFFSTEKQPVLFDPAVYYGHPEMELAFTKMFGGFSDAFYDAYAGSGTLEPGFSERIPVYNLYPLLVHVNLFGGHYAAQVRSFLKHY